MIKVKFFRGIDLPALENKLMDYCKDNYIKREQIMKIYFNTIHIGYDTVNTTMLVYEDGVGWP